MDLWNTRITSMSLIYKSLILSVGLCTLSHAIRIAIVGAGPTGLLLVSRFLDEDSATTNDISIDVYEGREDPRHSTENRSFAIGFSNRCISSVDVVPGLKDHIFKGKII